MFFLGGINCWRHFATASRPGELRLESSIFEESLKMGLPGEQLLEKFWVTISEKGIGSLLKPGQMRREGLVNLELERAKLLTLAQTERDVEDIKHGRKDISDFSIELEFSKRPKVAQANSIRREPVVNVLEALEVGRTNLVNDAVRREINTASSIVYAEEALCVDDSSAPVADMNDDWLYRWNDYSGEVSEDDLQKLWGRLLAGEFKAPGTYSLRCLDFLRNLSRSEADLIAKMASYVVNGFIWREPNNNLPLSFGEAMQLHEMGILLGVESVGLNFTLAKNPDGPNSWICVLTSNDRCVVVRGDNDRTDYPIQINTVYVSKLGMQILGLGDFKADDEYLKKLGVYFASQGCRVALADSLPTEPHLLRWGAEVAI
ncbi:DUF2806 domain-containing protein [Pseudomonas sp. So3.2b]|uniref:DUF2806 domain-containing protein n=1 Tax=Pseudomonas sp. So3.2b TaxID=2864101 RepID=UPI001C690ABA|nr:DUF2806 domain-containing protein [Pseudomonas sp. So3.2b]QYM70236.1 DUF2806 domain-containing protein [Pseudomonas sp. So3.2b]